MKLKNSYVLLMVMAIFLLISIGSVCASDDIAADSDIQESADTDVLLADGDDNGNGEATNKVNTTITASGDQKIYKDADKNISVSVKDNESQVINVEKSNLTVTENNKNLNFNYNNSIITITSALTVGEHKLFINYLGNTNYTNSSTEFILKIFGDNELKVPSVVDYDRTSVEIDVNLTNGVDDNTGLLNGSNTKVIINGTEIPISWDYVATNHKIVINNDTIAIPSTLTINYTEGGKSIVKNIAIKYKTQVVLNPTKLNITEGENATFFITIYGADGNIIALNKTELTITKTGAKNKLNETTGNLTLIGLKKGVYNITLTYNGTNVNNTSKANIMINVRGPLEINTNGTTVKVNSTKKGEIQITNITDGVDTFDFTKDDLNITVTYKDGNETKNITIAEWNLVNKTITFTLENGNFTNANLTIKYNETTTKNITVNRIYNVNAIPINTENEYLSGNFTFKLVDIDNPDEIIANKTVNFQYKITTQSITFIQTISAKTNESNIVDFANSKTYIEYFNQALGVGNHSVTLSGTGFTIQNSTQNVTVVKANITITVDEFKEYYGTDKKVKITVTNTKTGEKLHGVLLHLYMPQTSGKDYYFITNVNGTSEIAVGGLVGGTYDMTVSNNDTENINLNTTQTSITILQIPVTINTKDVTVYFNTGSTATIKITDKATGKALAGVIVLVQFDGSSKKTYLFQTNNKGQITFSASLNVGKHKMTVSTADTRYSGSTVTKTITVKKASGKFTAKKVTDYYKGVKYFTVKLTNTKNKKPIYDAKVNIKVFVSKTRYYNYKGNTGANGQIKLSLDNLKPGSYKVVISGASSKNYNAKTVTSKIVIKKAPTKLTPKKITAKKGAKKYFQVKVTNKKTKKVIKGVKVKIKVYTGKKAKTYTAKTSAKGIAKISTAKLKVGSHKVVVSSGNKYCVAKKAKSTIKITK